MRQLSSFLKLRSLAAKFGGLRREGRVLEPQHFEEWHSQRDLLWVASDSAVRSGQISASAALKGFGYRHDTSARISSKMHCQYLARFVFLGLKLKF